MIREMQYTVFLGASFTGYYTKMNLQWIYIRGLGSDDKPLTLAVL